MKKQICVMVEEQLFIDFTMTVVKQRENKSKVLTEMIEEYVRQGSSIGNTEADRQMEALKIIRRLEDRRRRGNSIVREIEALERIGYVVKDEEVKKPRTEAANGETERENKEEDNKSELDSEEKRLEKTM